MWTICVILILLYVSLILFIIKGWDKVTDIEILQQNPQTSFSIVIPFRNEETNLDNLLNSIAQLDYPTNRFEVQLIDDDSKDDSLTIIQDFQASHGELNIHVFKNVTHSASFKKDAIALGVEKAQFDWILTTDADCILPVEWLRSINSYIIEQKVSMVAGPVSFSKQTGFLSQLQFYDMIGLQGLAIGASGLGRPFLCNGANFGYTVQLYKKLNGFEQNDHIGSGDDLFFLNKALTFDPSTIGFLTSKSALVTTKAQTSWQDLINQRRRWASKTIPLQNGFGTLTTFIGLMGNLSIIGAFLLLFFGMIDPVLLVIMYLLKLTVDYLLIFKTSTKLGLSISIGWFFLSNLAYPFFVLMVAMASMNKGYSWKGRHYRN
ncbi:MAG: glycosyltransferase [Flavobacteriaceae bacterium]|nr:glycosyltransferase [Flavobacteriaceae bacterium]